MCFLSRIKKPSGHYRERAANNSDDNPKLRNYAKTEKKIAERDFVRGAKQKKRYV